MKGVKGNNHNPGGRPKLPWELIVQKKALRCSFDLAVCDLLALPNKDLMRIQKSPRETAMRRVIAKELLQAIQYGATKSFERMLSRVLGKPIDVEEMETRDTSQLAKQMLMMPRDEQIKLIERRLKELKDEGA